MNCWKSFNITKDHGSIRLIILSLFSLVTFYILFNITVTNFFIGTHLISYNPLIILLCLLFVVPGHKLTHCIPLWLSGKRAHLRLDRSDMVPIIQCHIKHPISKRLCLVVMAMPAVIGTLLTISFTWLFPSEMDYVGTLGSINFGLSAADFIYIINLIKAPHNAYVEDDQDGCKILIKQTS